jgi:hypothetical protein
MHEPVVTLEVKKVLAQLLSVSMMITENKQFP